MQTSLAWLAGIIDGEGCLTLFMKSNLSGNGKRIKSVTANLTITNTSATIINEARSLLIENGIKFTFVTPRASTGRPLRRLSVRNYDSILKLLDLVKPYMVGKTEQADLMRRFINGARVRKSLSSDERLAYFDEMRRINRFGNLIP